MLLLAQSEKPKEGLYGKKTVKLGRKAVEGIAKKLAERDANTACAFYTYQMKMPSAVKKLKKS